MAFRKRRHDSDGDSDEERLPLNNRDEEEPEPAKKARNMWSDMLLEEQLLEKGQKIDLDRSSRKQPNISRGPESYVMPADEFNKKQQRIKNQELGKCDPFQKPVLIVTPASDDLFGDAPGALNEEFGVKKNETKFVAPDEDSEKGWWGNKGASKRYAESRGHHYHHHDQREPRKPYTPKKTSQLMADEFSLDAMVAAEFAEDLGMDELGEQMAAVMGEKDPETVKKIVNAIGRDVSLRLFNGTKDIEQNGGMKTADGSRRRTPGGVFITLFKMDPEVSRETKDGIFGDMRSADKQRSKNKKKANTFTKKLEDMKKTMELASQAAEDVANEELGQSAPGDAPFDDEVVDMA